MKILCPLEPLASGFKTIISLCSAKSPTPGTGGVLIEADNESVKLSASDGEVTAISIVNDVKVETPGSVLTDKVVANLIMDMGDDNITLELDDKNSVLKLISEGKSYELPVYDTDEFRGLEWEESDNSIVLSSQVFKDSILKTSFAVSKEGVRYAFHAFLLEVTEKGEVYFVGSDGRRLSLVKINPEETSKFSGQYFIPKRAFSDFTKVSAPEGEPIKIYFSENKMCMKIGNTYVIAQLIEGKYPDYWAVIPKKLKNEVIIPVKPFEEALHRITLISNSDSPIAKLIFYSHGELEITTAMENKSGKESLEVKIEGEGGEINFNPVFILDFLRAVDRDVITFGFTNNEIPGKFQAGEDFIHIIMPITI